MTVVEAMKKILKNLIINLLAPFAKETTIHGISLVVVPRVHPLERLFWLTTIISAGGGAIALTISNWNRYNANPTVVSIQKDFRNWNNILPSATGCFTFKSDPELVAQYINETWGIDETDPKYDYYANFTKAVANISYASLNDFAPFKDDKELNKVNFLELAAKVHPILTGTLVTFDTRRKSYWTLIMSEKGICFTFNNKFANVLTYKVKGVSVTKPNVDESLLKCHYLNGLCYARYDSDPLSPIKFYVHSYLDVVHATTESHLYLGESSELEVNYQMQETSSQNDIRLLTPAQRKCRFDDEPLTEDVPVYSTTICYMACRYRLALQLCGCRPFFYHFMAGKVCNVSGLLCVAKHAERIMRPPSEIGCQCPQPCNIITYLALTPKVTQWKSGYFDQRITFRWGILHPTTKYRRDILFGFEDLVVSIGGTLALFLGVSFISLIEIVVFFFEFLISYCYKSETGIIKITHEKRIEALETIEKISNKNRKLHIRVDNAQKTDLSPPVLPQHYKKS